MGKLEKKGYLEAIRKRYISADKLTKGVILGEFCEVCGYHRKYAIRILNRRPRRRPIKPKPRMGRPRYQKPLLLKHLKAIWLATGYMGSKKLKAAMPEWVPHYRDQSEPLPNVLQRELCALSAPTIDRWLSTHRREIKGRKGLSGTKPGTLLKHHIPIKTDHWDVNKPGFLEADTVAHCGNSLAGDFIWSITYTDIFSTWTEIRATWNKGGEGVKNQTQDLETSLPFPILGFDCDNGSEFLNRHLIRYFVDRSLLGSIPVQFTRSRPYHKNDNAHVEQKNWTHVRQLFGYVRIGNPKLVELMNDLYKGEWNLYQNHFCPSVKLIQKEKVNSKYRKKYDSPKTPYQRLMESADIPEDTKKLLQKIHSALNPFKLKQQIDLKVRRILGLASVTSSVSQRS